MEVVHLIMLIGQHLLLVLVGGHLMLIAHIKMVVDIQLYKNVLHFQQEVALAFIMDLIKMIIIILVII